MLVENAVEWLARAPSHHPALNIWPIDNRQGLLQLSSRTDWKNCLSELGHEGNHEVEKTNGLDESETQNGVREQLALEGGVTGNTVQQSGEDETDTDTSTGQTDGGGTHTQVLGDLNQGVGHLGVVGAGLLLEGRAGGGVQDAGALHALHGAGLGHASDGTLGGVGNVDTHGRASDLGHGGGHARGENTGGGHCD